MQRYHLILQRHIFTGLATYFELGDLFLGAKSLSRVLSPYGKAALVGIGL